LTVIIGILCEDGVVVGSDSSATFGPDPSIKTIEGIALKIEILGADVITATTGSVGLAQRFNEELGTLLAVLRAPHAPAPAPAFPFMMPGMTLGAGNAAQQALARVPVGQVPLNVLSPVETGTIISERIIANFRRTLSQYQLNTGYGLGALVALIVGDSPQLFEFDGIQFHPEVKGIPDPARGDRVWRAASMGSGQMLADSFLAHAYRLLFGDRTPRVDRAKLVVSWALDHVIRYNTGGVGGKQQIAVLERNATGAWAARHVDAEGEVQEQVEELEDYIRNYGRAVAAVVAEPEALPPDIREELAAGAREEPVEQAVHSREPAQKGGEQRAGSERGGEDKAGPGDEGAGEAGQRQAKESGAGSPVTAQPAPEAT
jgi:hypothetical protein